MKFFFNAGTIKSPARKKAFHKFHFHLFHKTPARNETFLEKLRLFVAFYGPFFIGQLDASIWTDSLQLVTHPDFHCLFFLLCGSRKRPPFKLGKMCEAIRIYPESLIKKNNVFILRAFEKVIDIS